MMLLYSIVDDYGVCDRDGVGDAVASVWLIADALNGGGVWLIADASVWLIDEAAGTTVQTQLPRLAHGCAEMYTFVCTTVRNIAPPAPWLCANEPNDSDDDDADGDGDDDDDDEDERTTRTTNLISSTMSESPPASHMRLLLTSPCS